jgi:hypothetical protein
MKKEPRSGATGQRLSAALGHYENSIIDEVISLRPNEQAKSTP